MEPLSLKLPYTSCIYLNGRPLLPPVMTKQRILEMQQYKKMAVDIEKNLQNKKRKNFLTKVQSIIGSIQIKRSQRRCNSAQNLTSEDKEKEGEENKNEAYLDEIINNDGDDYDAAVSRLKDDDEFFSLENKTSDSSVEDQREKNHATGVADKDFKNQSLAKAGVDGAINAFSALQIDSLSTSEDSSSDTNNAILDSPKFNNVQMSGDLIYTAKVQLSNEGNGQSEKEVFFSAEESDFDHTESDSVTTVLTTNAEQTKSHSPNTYEESQRSVTDKTENSHKNALDESHNNSKSESNILASYPVQSGYLEHVYNTLNQHWGQFEQDIGNDTDHPEAIILYGSECGNVHENSIIDSEENNRIVSEKSESEIIDELTPSSVASTDLSKYMNAHSETTSEGLTPTRPSTAETDSTVTAINNGSATKVRRNLTQILSKADLPSGLLPEKADLSTKEKNKDDKYSPNAAHRSHVRRSSYTLEAPSPALLAHVQKYGDGISPTFNDMSSQRCHSLPGLNDKIDNCEAAEQNIPESHKAATSLLKDYKAIRQNKQKHLENYLKQLSAFPLHNSSSEGNMSGFVSCSTERDKEPLQMKPQTPVSATGTDGINLEEKSCIEEMRFNLLEKHQKEMEELLEKQQQEQALFLHNILALQESQGKANSHRNSVSPESESVATLDNVSSISDVIKKQQEKSSSSDVNTAVSQTSKKLSISQSKRTKDRESADSSPSKKGAFYDSRSKQTEIIAEEMLEKLKPKFDRVSAAAKGFLTRRLLKTERVQYIIKTIRDTLEFALNFQSETPIETGRITPAEVKLHERILSQVTGACYDFHDIFFQIPTSERMSIIRHDRNLKKEKAAKESKQTKQVKRSLSSATLKALERKKAKSRASGDIMQYQVKNQGTKLFSPKRPKVSKEIGKFPQRPKTASPRLSRLVACLTEKSPELLKGSHSARRSLYSNIESSKTHIYLRTVSKSRLSLK